MINSDYDMADDGLGAERPDEYDYEIEGHPDDVTVIENEINRFAQNPQNFYLDIDLDKNITPDIVKTFEADI